jgi:acyl-CoA synthetase (AMP-forming)/AMP-acid ligase II
VVADIRQLIDAGVTSPAAAASLISDSDTIVDKVRRYAARHRERLALVFLRDGEEASASLTYGELDRRARAVSGELVNASEPGDHFLLLFPHGLDFIVAFPGCLYTGRPPIPVAPPSLARVERVAAAVSATIGCHATAGGTHRIVSGARQQPPARRLRTPCTRSLDRGRYPAALLAGAAACRDPRPDDVAFLQYTSGSTTDPRGVVVRHRNLSATLEIARVALGVSDISVAVSWLPFFHDRGLAGMLLGTLWGGSLAVLMPPVAFLARPIRWPWAIMLTAAYAIPLAQLGRIDKAPRVAGPLLDEIESRR